MPLLRAANAADTADFASTSDTADADGNSTSVVRVVVSVVLLLVILLPPVVLLTAVLLIFVWPALSSKPITRGDCIGTILLSVLTSIASLSSCTFTTNCICTGSSCCGLVAVYAITALPVKAAGGVYLVGN